MQAMLWLLNHYVNYSISILHIEYLNMPIGILLLLIKNTLYPI